MAQKQHLEKYRPSMTSEVVHSWAADAQEVLLQQTEEIQALKSQLNLAESALRCCYNAAAGRLGLKTSDRQ